MIANCAAFIATFTYISDEYVLLLSFPPLQLVTLSVLPDGDIVTDSWKPQCTALHNRPRNKSRNGSRSDRDDLYSAAVQHHREPEERTGKEGWKTSGSGE